MKTQRKYSKKRQAILDAICSTQTHPNAEWIYSKVKGEYPEISLGTVYRNIALFKEQGDIICVANIGGQERYDGDVSRHSHFICSECECINDIGAANLREIVKDVSFPDGAEVQGYMLSFYGLCKECLEESDVELIS